MDYNPIPTRHVSESEETNKLLRRKRMLEFSTSTAEEWLELAELFLADDGRANYAYCLWQYRKHGGGDLIPVKFDYVPESVEIEVMDYTDV